jgi:hypothetical protein
MDSNIVVALIGAGATIAAAVISVVLTWSRNQAPTPMANPHPSSSQDESTDLDSILQRLERYRQRATFSAVAGLLGR